MSSIVTFIVILLIGSLFGGKNKKKEAEQKQTKPFTAQDNQPQTPFKKLKEMSQEMYKELQQEMQQEPEQQRRQQPVQRAEVLRSEVLRSEVQRSEIAIPREPAGGRSVEEVKRATRRATATRKTRDRLVSGSRKTRQHTKNRMELKQASINTVDLLPKTEEDIMKGIIFSEIFGPPKSKR